MWAVWIVELSETAGKFHLTYTQTQEVLSPAINP